MKTVPLKQLLFLLVFLSTSIISKAQSKIDTAAESCSGAIPPPRDVTYVSSKKLNTSLPTSGNGKMNSSYSLFSNATSFDNTDVRLNPSSIYPQTEPHISINKNNPLNIIVSLNTTNDAYNDGHPNSAQGYYYSFDGGLTWAGSDFLPNESSSYGRGDPSTCFDAAGNGYISTMGADPVWPSNNNVPINYSVQKTTDGGSTWQPQVIGAGLATGNTPFCDKGMITCDDVASSPYANNFYAVWTEFSSFTPYSGYIKLNKSIDGTTTFQTPIILRNNSGFGFGAIVKTGPAGESYVAWADYGSPASFPASSVKFVASTDAWNTYTTYTAFTYSGINTGGALNAGTSYLNDIRTPDYIAMAVDKSCGPHNGRIYIAYAANINPSGQFASRIQVRYSDNDGTTWSAANTVNIPNGRQNYMPWIAVDDATGLVCVAYNSLDQLSGYSTNTYLAYSTNGGNNWDNQLVSDVPFITQPVPGWSSYMGDYIGVTAYNGNAYVAWTDNRLGTSLPSQWQTYVSRVSFDISVTASQNPVCLNQSTTLSVNLPEAGTTYNWYNASTGGTLLGIGSSYVTNPITTTTTFYVSICNGPRTPVTVTINTINADLYIKDTQTPTDDDGTEPNPNQPWNIVDGVDVWIRNSAETQTSTNPPHYANENIHQSAEWSSTWSTNNTTLPRIYVKVRNRGCSTVTGTVHLYYHKFATNDQWNTCVNGLCGSWQEILCDDINGNDIIDGSETNSCTSNVITLAPGQDGVIEQIWYPAKIFPNPTISGNKNEYCLLARLVCSGGLDPINTEVNGISAALNAKNSNNIVQKNVMFVNNIPGIICNDVNFGNFSTLRSTNKLDLVDASSTFFTGSQGLVSIDLGKDLYNAWVQGGRKGTGIADSRDKYNHMSPTGVLHNHSHLGLEPNPYEITLIGGAATLENISLAPNEIQIICTKFNYYPGPASTVPFQYSFRQYESFANGQPNYNFTGAVKFNINKPECSEVNAGNDVTIGRVCSTQLTAFPIVAGATYIWRNNATGDSIGSGISVSVSPHITTIYEVEMSTPDNCIAYDVVTVNVNANTIPCACPGPTFDKVVLKKDKLIYNENVVIKDKLTVQAGTTLRIEESEIIFMKDAILEIVPGGRLEIINSLLRSCNSLERWKMIRVVGNGMDGEQLKISGSLISDAITSIEMKSVRSPKIIGNTINGGSVAIDMSNSQDFTISNNNFNTNEVAIKTTQTKIGTASLIEQNNFLSNKTSLQFVNDNHSKLSINCNKFNSYTDYAIYSNSSTLKNQGATNMGAGNTFNSSSTKMNNKLYHNGSAMKYYYDPSLPVNLNTNSALTAMALPSQVDNSCQLNARMANDNPSSKEIQNIIAVDYSELISSVPNPASDKTTLIYKLRGDISNAEIRISTLLGNLTAKYSITKDSNTLDVDCSSLANGIYFYSLIVNGNIVSTKKMIISK